VQLVLHVEQPAGLLLGELEDRDAGRGGEHLGDELSSTSAMTSMSPDFHSASRSALRAMQVLLVVAQARGLLEVLGVDRRLLLAGARTAIFSSNSRRSGGAVIRGCATGPRPRR
jgi:hypothetical protein